jgi:hypothetical protein
MRTEEKAAKGVTNPDGTPLRTKAYGLIKTERTAQSEYISRAADQRYAEVKATHGFWDGTPEGQQRRAAWIQRWEGNAAAVREDAELILVALAHKRGTTVEEQRKALAVKVEKKYRETVRVLP